MTSYDYLIVLSLKRGALSSDITYPDKVVDWKTILSHTDLLSEHLFRFLVDNPYSNTQDELTELFPILTQEPKLVGLERKNLYLLDSEGTPKPFYNPNFIFSSVEEALTYSYEVYHGNKKF